MGSRRIYTVYKEIVKELGLFQLDVYRVREDDKIVDMIRLYDPTKNKSYTVNLGKTREAMTLLEFLEAIVKGSADAEVVLPERKVNQLRKALAEAEKAPKVEAK